MIIDFFTHVLPKNFIHALKESKLRSAGPHKSEVSGLVPQSYFFDIENRIRLLKKYGVDMQLLSLARPPIWGAVPPRDVAKLMTVANDAVAEIVEKYGEHFLGAATLPILNGEATDELMRCVEDLGLRAVQVFSNIDGRPLDAPEFFPFYERAQTLRVPILIHPTNHDYYPWIRDYLLNRIFGWPFDTSLAMARLVFGGILERYPRLTFVVHHHGAMAPFFAGRITGFYDHRAFYGGDQTRRLRRNPLDYFKMFYADTASFGWELALQPTYRFFGADRMVFASDYPFGPEKGVRYLRTSVQAVKKMEIPLEEKEKIFEKNAKELLKLE